MNNQIRLNLNTMPDIKLAEKLQNDGWMAKKIEYECGGLIKYVIMVNNKKGIK